jgi:hypothetical protein
MLTGQQLTLLLTPWLLLVTTYGCFRFLKRRLSITWAYFGGFLFYWLVWCLLLPIALLDPTALLNLFRPVAPFGEPGWLGAFCLIAPPLIALITIFPRELRRANRTIVLISIVLAIVNGTLEEVLWRGAYLVVFRDNLWLALPPNLEEDALFALLTQARLEGSSVRTIAVNFPSGVAERCFQTAGYEKHLTLIWMNQSMDQGHKRLVTDQLA